MCARIFLNLFRLKALHFLVVETCSLTEGACRSRIAYMYSYRRVCVHVNIYVHTKCFENDLLERVGIIKKQFLRCQKKALAYSFTAINLEISFNTTEFLIYTFSAITPPFPFIFC